MGIDLIGKEEMLEVEGKIEKILGKMPIVEVDKTVKAVKEKIKEMNSCEKDLTESLSDNVMEDKAVDLSDEKVEQHIAELFSRPEVKNDESAPPKHSENTPEPDQILSRRSSTDNSVREVRDNVEDKEKDKEEEHEKIPQKNGSSKH